jgi:hypothetical protein
MSPANDKKQLRSFGLIVGGVFLAIGLWPLVRGGNYRFWAVTLAALLVMPAIVAPGLLKYPNAVWMRIGHVLGWINTKVILSAMFIAVFTPTAAILRLLGKDPLHRSFSDADSYRIPRQARDRTHLKHQF